MLRAIKLVDECHKKLIAGISGEELRKAFRAHVRREADEVDEVASSLEYDIQAGVGLLNAKVALLEETADVMIALLGQLRVCGVKPSNLAEAMRRRAQQRLVPQVSGNVVSFSSKALPIPFYEKSYLDDLVA